MLGRLRCKTLSGKIPDLIRCIYGFCFCHDGICSLPAVFCENPDLRLRIHCPCRNIKETIRSFHLPVSFCYALLHLGARIFGHFNLSESTALSAVKQTKLPILFIHGDHDSIVPPKMCDELYGACASRKKKLIITGSQHAVNAMADFDSYEREIMNFIKESGIKI